MLRYAPGPGHCGAALLTGPLPLVLNPYLAGKIQTIRYEGYSVIYSDVTETPLASAEHLTREHLEAPHPPRSNDFHPDKHIPVQYRSELSDYRGSGFDRGHMFPAEDAWNTLVEHQSFSLANMIPQNPDDNRHLWAGIESSTRYLADKAGSIYVVTGPIFYGHNWQRLDGHVIVPTYIFKAVYDPVRNAAAAYLVRNASGTRYAVISIAKLDQISGLSVFPALPRDIRMLQLPRPWMRDHLRAVRDQNIVP